MAMFVHLTSEKNSASVQRTGIRKSKSWNGEVIGVYAMPVTENFYISHQWLRELKSTGQRTIVGVYFRVPDDEKVLVAHYNSEHVEMTASDAVAVFLNEERTEGYEVIVPRKIEAKEIHKIRHLPQVLGWRYDPDAHLRHFCGCPICVRPGTVKSKVRNRKWESEQ